MIMNQEEKRWLFQQVKSEKSKLVFRNKAPVSLQNGLTGKKSLLFLALTANKTVFGAFTTAQLQFPKEGNQIFKDPNAFLFNLASKEVYSNRKPLEHVIKTENRREIKVFFCGQD
jgi:hypothetical protein